MLALAAALLVQTACDKRLDIQPQQDVDAAEALTDEQSVESAVVGAYGHLGNAALYGTNLVLLPDLQAAENYISWQGTFQSYREVARKTMTSINSESQRTWIRAYQAINTVNNVLESLNLVKDEDLRKQLEGEARFIRGILYFELVRMYALPWDLATANTQAGVPLILKATRTDVQAEAEAPRATVAEVYAQVIADLTQAAALLPEENGSRADLFAATGFLARVYLQQSRFAEARDAANTVIESGYFRLNPSVAAIYRNRNTAESIFEIQQNDQNNAGTANDGLTTFYASMPGVGRGDVQILTTYQPVPPATEDDPEVNLNKTVYDMYEENDARRTELVYVGTGRRAGRLRAGKWTDFGANIPILRLAEMVLIRAEANFRLGTAVGATPLEDVNAVRLRADATPYETLTLELILLERELELAFEGVRIHDIKRRRENRYFAWNDPEAGVSDSQREIDANDLLTQNTEALNRPPALRQSRYSQ
jgi:hypothetical protein